MDVTCPEEISSQGADHTSAQMFSSRLNSSTLNDFETSVQRKGLSRGQRSIWLSFGQWRCCAGFRVVCLGAQPCIVERKCHYARCLMSRSLLLIVILLPPVSLKLSSFQVQTPRQWIILCPPPPCPPHTPTVHSFDLNEAL